MLDLVFRLIPHGVTHTLVPKPASRPFFMIMLATASLLHQPLFLMSLLSPLWSFPNSKLARTPGLARVLPLDLCSRCVMLIQAAPSPLMRTRDSGDYTMNSRSCLSTSTMAIPTITGSSAALSACSSSNTSAHVRTCSGWAGQGQQGRGEVAGQGIGICKDLTLLHRLGTKPTGVVAVGNGSVCVKNSREVPIKAERVASDFLFPQKVLLVLIPRTKCLANMWIWLTFCSSQDCLCVTWQG